MTDETPVAPPLPSGLPPVIGGPPPPPLPAGRGSGYQSGPPSAPELPRPIGEAGDVMASIRATGGLASGRLRKVDPSQKRDRSAAMVSGGTDGGTAPARASPAPAVSAGEPGLTGVLNAVLIQRNLRVSEHGGSEHGE